jgi:hypothetical protein
VSWLAIAPAYLYAFWLVYVLVMGLYRAYLDKRLGRFARVLGAPVVAFGALMDVIANCTLAWLLFLEPPREWLVTTRLQRYMAAGASWRRDVAYVVCSKLLDPFDPSGRHC